MQLQFQKPVYVGTATAYTEVGFVQTPRTPKIARAAGNAEDSGSFCLCNMAIEVGNIERRSRKLPYSFQNQKTEVCHLRVINTFVLDK